MADRQKNSSFNLEVATTNTGKQKNSSFNLEVATTIPGMQKLSQLQIEVASYNVGSQKLSQLIAEVAYTSPSGYKEIDLEEYSTDRAVQAAYISQSDTTPRSSYTYSFSPTDILGCSLWVAADKITGLSDGDDVSSWTDHSGNNRHLTQATESQRPHYKLDGPGGLPTIRHTASASQFLSNSYNFAQPCTIFAVSIIGATKQRLISGVSNNWLMGYWSGYQERAYFNGWITSNNSITALINPLIYCGTIDGTANSKLYENGVLVADSGAGKDGPNGIQTCGELGEYSDGDVSEIIIYNSVLSDNDRASVTNYLAEKYLCVFNESILQSQGSGALKFDIKQGYKGIKWVKTLATPIDLTGYDAILLKLKSNRQGNNVKIIFKDSGGTEIIINPNIRLLNTWETKIVDLTNVSDANKDAISTISITINNDDSDMTFYLDSIYAIDPYDVPIEAVDIVSKSSTDLVGWSESSSTKNYRSFLIF